MNNHNAAIMVLNQADALKSKLCVKSDVLNEPDFRVEQHRLQTMYHQVLVLDLEYALDKKVEQELWTYGFKHYISALQNITRDKKHPRRSEAQALLTACLQSASGFYLTLLQELYSRFNIDSPYRKKGAVYGMFSAPMATDQLSAPQSSSCIYICQYCLVHLGDIARYMSKRREAESFYRQAIKASPTSGHPYNQLALLEANQGDKLSTVFHYVRGIAVKNPFPATATNLANTFSSFIDKEESINDLQTKMSVNDFIRLFLRVHGLLHSVTELEEADLSVKSINATLTALVATQSFTSDKLMKMTVINLYTLRHTVGDGKLEDLTTDEQKVKELILDLLAGSLSAFLLPVYTLKIDASLLDYYALPAIKLIFYWISKDPGVLEESVFANKLQIWPSFCKLLNHLQSFVKDFSTDKYTQIPLLEDRELQGFLPLQQSFKDLDFTADIPEPNIEKYIRAERIIEFGAWLTNIDVNSTKLIIRKSEPEDTMFEPGCIQPDPTDKLLEEMKSIEISDKNKKSKEKRGGILKPQGSLEKAREEREQVLLSAADSNGPVHANYNNPDFTKLKRVKQNVALQSIFKKIEENKQVKFSSEIPDHDKEKALKNRLPNGKAPQLNQPYRAQPFILNSSSLITTPSELQDIMKFNMPNRSNLPPDINLRQNSGFPNNDIPIQNPPLPVLPQNQLMFNSAQKANHFPSNLPDHQTPFNQYTMQYKKIPYPPNRPFNTWNNEEHPPLNSWWPNPVQPSPTNFSQPNTNYLPPQNNYIQGNPNYAQPPPPCENYQARFPFPNSMGPMPRSANIPLNLEFTKSNNRNELSTGTWNGGVHRNPTANDNLMGFNMNHSMSVRQAMLNETKHMQNIGPRHTEHPAENNIHVPMTSNTPGYSLFNPSGWAPNLPGQICSNSAGENSLNARTHHSLFTGGGPQSLKQLLEQQNQLTKDET